jgi:DNA-binding NarL/FixJ family response regulator
LNTVRGYVQSILEKLDAHSRLEAILHANSAGLLDICSSPCICRS